MTQPLLDDRLLGLIAENREGVLATIAADGRPQLSNVLYTWDAGERIARISTTADRAKARNLERDPRAALHVSGDHFWQYAVAEGARSRSSGPLPSRVTRPAVSCSRCTPPSTASSARTSSTRR
jgi:PPOX class probable F420-dependent enzyme